MPKGNLYLPTLRDAIFAFVAAFVGLPVTSILGQLSHRPVADSLTGFARVRAEEWAILVAVFILPASLLGTAAGFLLRRRGRGRLAAATAAGVAFGASALGLSAFFWWLSKVL